MRHRKKGKILGRKKDERKALLRHLLRSLILYGKVETTQVKASVLQREAARYITKARHGTLQDRREAARVLDDIAVKKLFETLGPRYKDRNGGYTRIMKRNPRQGDAAPMAIIELV